MNTRSPLHISLVGPTAAGKSAMAMSLAREMSEFEIVSVDSMQVYRGMDIGTAKPTAEEQADVPHHLIDLVDPDTEFALAEFQRAALDAIADVEARGKRVLLVGGTGLYLRAITDELTMPGRFLDVRAELETIEDTRALHARLVDSDPAAAARMEPDNRRRIIRALEVTIGSGQPFSSFGPGLGAYPETKFRMFALRMESVVNARRIEERVDRMFADGLVDEVRTLRDRFELSKTARQAIGYKEVLDYLVGPISQAAGQINPPADADRAVAVDEVKRRTRSMARRQRVWFRRDPRMEFLDVDDQGGSTGGSPADRAFAVLLAAARD